MCASIVPIMDAIDSINQGEKIDRGEKYKVEQRARIDKKTDEDRAFDLSFIKKWQSIHKEE